MYGYSGSHRSDAELNCHLGIGHSTGHEMYERAYVRCSPASGPVTGCGGSIHILFEAIDQLSELFQEFRIHVARVCEVNHEVRVALG